MSITIAELHEKLVSLIDTEINQPKTKNKGETGLLLETLTGIPHSSNALDCLDGELKTFPLKKLTNGSIVAKETLAVTMLSKDSLKDDDFASSKVYNKMKRMLVVPYQRTGDIIVYKKPVLIDFTEEKYKLLVKEIENDYKTIREKYLADGTLKSEDGKYLQNRTKGAGHGSTSRAFYLRPQFMNEFVINS